MRASFARRQKQTRKGRGNGELILVVDDEEAVRNITTILLRKNGFTTLVASEGKEAITLYDREQASIKLVILDLMMPVMDGECDTSDVGGTNRTAELDGIGNPTHHPPSTACYFRDFVIFN